MNRIFHSATNRHTSPPYTSTRLHLLERMFATSPFSKSTWNWPIGPKHWSLCHWKLSPHWDYCRSCRISFHMILRASTNHYLPSSAQESLHPMPKRPFQRTVRTRFGHMYQPEAPSWDAHLEAVSPDMKNLSSRYHHIRTCAS